MQQKNILWNALVGLLVVVCVGCASGPSAQVPRVSLAGLGPNSPLGPNTQEFILEVKSGDSVPLSMGTAGSLFSAEGLEGSLVAKRDMWLWMAKSGIQISFDGVSFEPLSDAVQGSLDVGTAANEQGVSVKVKLQADPR